MFSIIYKINFKKYYICVSKNQKFEYQYLLFSNKLYKIIYENINKNELYIGTNNQKQSIFVKPNNIYNYNIEHTINRINITIIEPNNYEINETELLTNMYAYLTDLFVFNNMEIILNNCKILITFNEFDKYYLINENTKIIINNRNNYKFYNYIVNIDETILSYISLNVKYINGCYKRNFLDDIYLLQKKDFEIELHKNKNCLYIGKKFNVFSNNCEFVVCITYIDLLLQNDQKKTSGYTIYNFVGDNIKYNKIICEKGCVINDGHEYHKKIDLQIIIENGPITNHIYDIDKLTPALYNILKLNYIKINDKINVNVENDILIIKIICIKNTFDETIAFYINEDTNINITVHNNVEKKLFAHNPKLIYDIETIDVYIQKYVDDYFKENKIPEIQESDVINAVRNTLYILYNETTLYKNKMILKFKNIIVKNQEISNKCVLKFTYKTKINIFKDVSCNNIQLMNDCKINNGSNITISIDEIKNIKNKLLENRIAGMDTQIDKIIKEILLPRSNFINDNLKKFIKYPKGIILYGPPGTGKTTLARNIGKVIGITDCRIQMINAPEIFAKYVGESEENIRKLFKKPKEDKHNLHLIIIDECDSIFRAREQIDSSSGKNDVLNQFLSLLDGLEIINNIIIIGITNRFSVLDKAILRPGRMNCHIEISLPTERERLEIIKLYHTTIEGSVNFDTINFDNLITFTKGFSGAEIENIYTKVIELVIETQFNEKEEIIITNEILFNIIQQK
jgi:ATP-dependent 26S proteasome regulatory subunit